jgi:pre-mRNA-splicing factor SPF27
MYAVRCGRDAHADSDADIDAEPTTAQRAAAQALITAELSAQPDPLHPLLPAAPASAPSSALAASELARVAAAVPLAAIDLTRYEALTAPAPDAPIATHRALLARAHASQTYLARRTSCLAELELHGKDAWLAGNEGLTADLAVLERELAGRRGTLEAVAVERQRAQQAAEAELHVLEESWRTGVARMVDVEIAAEGLRAEILVARRAGRV